MARTPLMRALQRLAWEHGRRRSWGSRSRSCGSASEVPGSRGGSSSSGPGRPGRQWRWPGPLAFARPARPAGAPRIAIVGGGIAGLAAALTLQDKGVYADVYESSSRLGGRMHSDWTEFGTGFWENGQQAELCGELIDSNHKTILQLAQRFGLATVDLLAAQPNVTTDTYWIFGADYPYSQAATISSRSTTRCRDKYRRRVPDALQQLHAGGQAFDKMTVYDWITQLRPRRPRLADGRRCSTPPTTRSTAPRRPASPR